jgi:hypothetical protein
MSAFGARRPESRSAGPVRSSFWQRGLVTGTWPHYTEHGPVALETPAYLIRYSESPSALWM